MAVESMSTRTYSPKTDVYSFGGKHFTIVSVFLSLNIKYSTVTMWECLMRKQPWTGLDDVQVVLAVTTGKQLPMPRCAPELESILRACFDGDPNARPSFQELFN